MVVEFKGRENWRAFLDELQAQDERGGTISPNGAAMMLGVTRQRVQDLVNANANIRAYAYYDHGDWRARVYEVSVPDLLFWAVRSGRIQSEEDLGLPWEGLKLQVRRLLERKEREGWGNKMLRDAVSA